MTNNYNNRQVKVLWFVGEGVSLFVCGRLKAV